MRVTSPKGLGTWLLLLILEESMTNDKEKSTPIDIFRSAFFRDRHEFANQHGASAFDQARTLYRCRRSNRHVIINDGFYGVGRAEEITGLIKSITSDWWSSRVRFTGDNDDLELVVERALYAHYLPEVGSDFVVELHNNIGEAPEVEGNESQAKVSETPIYCCWRVEANGRAHALRPPKDEGMFHAQTGTFYNLRGGLRWLGSAFAQVPELRVCEVESGLFVGVRSGVPGDPDPASRPDEDLAHAFSAHVDHRFDTIEFLGSAISEQYPFQSERFSEWLGQWASAIEQGTLDIFLLANSERFTEVVEEYCCLHAVEPTLSAGEDALVSSQTWTSIAAARPG